MSGRAVDSKFHLGSAAAARLDAAHGRSGSLADALSDVAALRAFVSERREAIDRNPAAWCAVETALLDRMGRASGRSIEALLGVEEGCDVFRYTVVLSDLPLEQSRKLMGMALAAGIRSYQLKLGGQLETDRARLAMVLHGVPDAEVRLDANNPWGDDADAAIAQLGALGGRFDAVEEPLAPRRAADRVRIADRLGCAIVLDESLTTEADVARFDPARARWIANLKVAKVGGAVRGARACAVERALQRYAGLALGVPGRSNALFRFAGAATGRAAPSVDGAE